MSDLIQEGFLAWHRGGDRRAGREAIDALAREWRPRVRRFFAAGAPDEVEEALQGALCALCVAEGGAQPRVIAPPDAGAPAAWRRKVLRNHLIDGVRRRERRSHAERAERAGLSPRVEAEVWRARRAGGLPQDMRAAAPEPAAEAPDLSLLASRRRAVLARLPGLAIRRRVVLALALGIDPSPWAALLAKTLSEDPSAVLARIERALHGPHEDEDTGELPLSRAAVRVVWPHEPEDRARESARKALERAIEDLAELRGGDA